MRETKSVALYFGWYARRYTTKRSLASNPLMTKPLLVCSPRQAGRNRESIIEFRKGQRKDLVQREEAGLQVLLEYLPTQLAPEVVADLARIAIQETGAKGPTDKGKVMAKLMPQIRGKAEGSTVNYIVTELLEKL